MKKAQTPNHSACCDNPKRIAAYLNKALETNDTAKVVTAIGNMIRAQNVSRLSRNTKLSREALYRSFSGQGVPGFDNVLDVLFAMGVKLVAKPTK
jgi:probable addiction module antidote protein